MVSEPNISSKKIIFLGIFVGILWFLVGNWVYASDLPELKDLQIHPLPEDRVQLELCFSKPVAPPKGFAVEKPASVILDFKSAINCLPKALTNQSIAVGMLKGITVLEAGNKTRLVINLKKMVPYETIVEGNRILLTLGAGEDRNRTVVAGFEGMKAYEICSFDFRRGREGEGRLIFNTSSPNIAVDFREEKGKILARFSGADIPCRLLRKYDVIDFGTPVQGFLLERNGSDVVLKMDASGDYDKIAYQMDNQFIIEVRGLTRAERAIQRSEGRFTGERISLNFQDVDVRAALQIIADFAGFNLITSDSVRGNVTLRLMNVPWDQALDIILKSKGLDKRQQGNVVMIAPTEEIATREKQELQNQKQVAELGPLRSELVVVNYAKAEELAAIIKEKGNSLMTSRGNVTVDKRTNTLLIQDIDVKLAEINALLKKLDVPIRQVEISTQIITADDSCESALGMRFGGALSPTFGSRRLGIGRTVERSRAIGSFVDHSGRNDAVPPPTPTYPVGLMNAPPPAGPLVNTTEGLFSDLPVIMPNIATLGLSLARLPNGTLLDLELQALEAESKAKTIARPKLLTTDQNKAVVEQGVDIPYQEASSSGATTTAYKKAVLRLEVTPHITPDDKISMDLSINQDEPGDRIPTANGGEAVSVRTNHLETKVLVDNGETVVLGGVLTLRKSLTRQKVPFFGDIPFIGVIFRNRHTTERRQELLIFITPKIVKPNEDKV